MDKLRKVTCPACQGKGCRLCQGKGTLYLTQAQVNKIKTMLQHLPRPAAQPGFSPSFNLAPNQTSLGLMNQQNPGEKKAALITLIIILVLAGSGLGSWLFLKSLRPFFAVLISLASVGSVGLLWNSKYLKSQPPNDFSSALGKKPQVNDPNDQLDLSQMLPPMFPNQ